MKSKGSYEMHTYASPISPSDSLSDIFKSNNDDITSNKSAKVITTKTTMKSSSNEKYSLRQRQKRRNAPALPTASDSPGYVSDENNNNNHSNNNNPEPHYALATFYTQNVTTPTKTKAKNSAKRKKFDNSTPHYTTSALPTALSTPPKAKTKAAPLSKYRRKTANARERTRMREINSAFENLRHCVPHTITGDDAAQSNEKLTKITTLRLAMKYISILTEALANPTFGEDFLQECKRDGDHRFTEELQQLPYTPGPPQLPSQYDEVENEATLPAKKSKSHAKSKATKSNAARTTTTKKFTSDSKATPSAKRQAKKQKLQPYADAYSSAASTCSSHSSSSSTSVSSSSSSSAYATLSSSSAASSIAGGSPNASSAFLLDSPVSAAYMHNMVSVHQSMSDLSSLMLESDGESMQLSEPCLSPLQSSYHLLGGTSQQSASTTNSAASALSSYNTSTEEHIALSTLENPLELSLRLLDSSADSLDFNVNNSDQHAPPTCISPLVTLDSFNPFGDLLHSDFPEHSTLDLFLA